MQKFGRGLSYFEINILREQRRQRKSKEGDCKSEKELKKAKIYWIYISTD